ncbi:MAG: segregation/condensation protein A [Candidatus Nanohaloarchaea archaeon]
MDIDIAVLIKRYRDYIQELQEFDLEVPARAIRLVSALLRIKTLAVTGGDPLEDEMEENPMDFEDPMDEELMDEENSGRNPDLEMGPEISMPVRPRPKRRMTLNELKDALDDAMEVKERREERQELREDMDQRFEVDEKSLNEKINSLFSKLTNLVTSRSSEGVSFNQLIDNNESEEKIEKFLHVLQLENEERVRCIQEEWLGDLRVKPNEDEVAN